MAYLTVDPKVVKAAAEFVESTRTPEKPAFGFRRPGDDPLATAMGLSCRQLLGRKDEIQWQGLDRLIADKQGLTSCEYRYFSMSALRTSRTDAATKWRERLVDSLGKAQVREGPDRGSWFDAEDPAARSDGRLFQSVLNTLFLNMRFDKWRIQERPQDNDFPL
jgi:hypothetical protein